MGQSLALKVISYNVHKNEDKPIQIIKKKKNSNIGQDKSKLQKQISKLLILTAMAAW